MIPSATEEWVTKLIRCRPCPCKSTCVFGVSSWSGFGVGTTGIPLLLCHLLITLLGYHTSGPFCQSSRLVPRESVVHRSVAVIEIQPKSTSGGKGQPGLQVTARHLGKPDSSRSLLTGTETETQRNAAHWFASFDSLFHLHSLA